MVFGDSSYDVQLNNILTRKRDTAKNVLSPMGEIDPEEFANVFDGALVGGDSLWEDADRLGPLQFERWIAAKFKKAGFAVKNTRATGDFGVDLLIRDKASNEVVALVQAKHKTHAEDPLVLGEKYYAAIRRDSAAYQSPSAKLVVVSNALKATTAQRAKAKKHEIGIYLREELDDFIRSL